MINWSDVAEVDELSEPEFQHHADSAGIPTSGLLPATQPPNPDRDSDSELSRFWQIMLKWMIQMIIIMIMSSTEQNVP